MAIKRCFRCKGSKVTMGLGGLEKKCVDCGGIGFSTVADNKDVDNFLSEKKEDLICEERVEIKQEKRRGRPPKSSDESRNARA